MITLDDWQEEILTAKGNILLCTGRQVGKTTIFSLKAAKRLIEKKTQIIVVSLTEDQAELIIFMILGFLEQLAPKMIPYERNRPTKNKIELINGSKVLSRPIGLTGDSVRGFTGDVLIIDEASRMNEAVFAAAKPTLLTTAGEIWICSTPFGRQGYFWECYNNTDRFKVFHKSSVEVIESRAISPSWTIEKKEAAIRFLEGEKKDMGKTRFGQEYLGLFIEDLQQFFPDDLILRTMKLKRPNEIRRGKDFYCGVDLARMGDDASTFEIIQIIGTKLFHVEHQVTKRTLLSQSTTHIINLNKQYDFNKIFIDDEGIGVGVYDHLLDNDETKRKIVSINNSKRVLDKDETMKVRLLKEDLYNNLLRLMEQGLIELLDDSDIFTSLKSVQYEYTTNEKGKSYLKIFGNDTHIAEGLIRAAWSVKYKPLNIWVKSI